MSSYDNCNLYVREIMGKIYETIMAKEGWFEFTKISTDGRVNSISAEPVITEYLLNYPGLEGILVKKNTTKKDKKSKGKSKKSDIVECEDMEEDEDNRSFGDIGIDISKFGYTEPFPCNIKVISKNNLSSNNTCGVIKLINYTFGKECKDHDGVAQIIKEIKIHGYDNYTPFLYGLIMIQKESKKCWIGTLDEIPEKFIATNPSNPLQVPFLENTVRTVLKKEEYTKLLCDKLMEVYKKKASPYLILSQE